MAAELSDDELLQKLREFGEDGPITSTTRSVWVKRLEKLQDEEKKNRRRSAHVTRLSRFSSDDSSDAGGDVAQTRRRRRRTLPTPLDRDISRNASSTSNNVPVSPEPQFKKPAIPRSPAEPNRYLMLDNLVRPSLTTRSTRQQERDANYDFDSSDSELDNNGGSGFRSWWSRRSPRNKPSTLDTEGNATSSGGQVGPRGNGSPGALSISLRGRTNFLSNSHGLPDDQKSPFADGSPHNSNHVPFNSNGFSDVDESRFVGEFQTREDPGTTTNYSQCVSMLLVVVLALFFAVVGMLYVGVRQRDLSPSLTNANVIAPVCETSAGVSLSSLVEQPCIPQKNLGRVLHLTRKLHTLLAKTAGAYDCGDKSVLERRLTVEKAKQFLKEVMPEYVEPLEFDQDFLHSLLLIEKNENWGIKLYLTHGSIKVSAEVHALESVASEKPFWCRLEKAVERVFTKILIAALFVVLLYILYIGIKHMKWMKQQEQKYVFYLVKRILEVLQQHHESCQANTQLEPYIAIPHIRDMLIAPEERKGKQKLWDRAVRFVEDSESRIKVENQRVAGEDYRVWRWLQPTESPSSRQGKVWQGKAFASTGKGANMLPFSPTPCLKIRNMFDPDVEYGNDWHIRIQDAILEKCEGNNGIVHIKVDTDSKEGCVYMKCIHSEASGQAYKVLHGWWFDGKLVTVKYLHLERYHERFPDSVNSTTPLSPSNNMRLSLSAPFHSSPLERS